MANIPSVRLWFGNNTAAWEKYKKAKAEGKYKDINDYISKGGTQIGMGSSSSLPSYQDVIQGQENKQNDFLQRYGSAISGQPKITDIFNRLSSERGLPALQSANRGLQSSYEAIPEQENVAGKQIGISSSRLARRVSGRQAEMAPSVQRGITQEQNALGDISNQLQLESSQQDQALLPYSVEASMIGARAAAEMTGWSVAKGNELSMALQRLQNEGATNIAELNNIAALAQQENAFEIAKKYHDYTKTGNTPYVSPAAAGLGGVSTLDEAANNFTYGGSSAPYDYSKAVSTPQTQTNNPFGINPVLYNTLNPQINWLGK